MFAIARVGRRRRRAETVVAPAQIDSEDAERLDEELALVD
jgi:hypothetical protein